MVQLNQSGNEQNENQQSYGLGNPNVMYTAVAWDVFLAPLALVLLSIGMLIWYYDLSLVGFIDWLSK